MEILVVGNYCHDTLTRPDGTFELLGGSSSYISNALEPTGASYVVIGKVGMDFKYHSQIHKDPIVSTTHLTTHFHDKIFPIPFKKCHFSRNL